MKTKIADFFRVCAFVAFGSILMLITYNALTQLSVRKHSSYYIIKAMFDDLKQLQVGDDVRIAGVRVGSVEHMRLNKQDKAVALLNIDKKYKIHDDALASICVAGLLGANYVSISPGSSEKFLQDREYIHTEVGTDMSSLFKRFDNVGKKLDGFLNDCKTVSQRLVKGEGTLGKLLSNDQAYEDFRSMMNSIQTAANKVQSAADNADNFLDELSNFVKDIKSGEGLFGKLVFEKKWVEDADRIVKNIREFTESLNNKKSTLGRLINEGGLYDKAEEAIDKLGEAVESVSNSGPITAVGAVASSLF